MDINKKREEIREGVRGLSIRIYGDNTGVHLTRDSIDTILTYLDSVGCVLKIERELPDIFDSNEDVISALAYKKKLTGYGAFESLVEE